MTRPLTPPDCDLTDFARMMIDIPRLRGSDFDATPNDAAWRAGLNLWMSSWHQVPAASLSDDDVILTKAAGLGRDLRSWRKIKAEAIRGWIKCDDGLLYHPVVAEYALEAWLEKLAQALSSGAGNAKRWKVDFDPAPIEADIDRTATMLRALNPKSKALTKIERRRSRPLPGATPDGTPEPSRRDNENIPTGSQEEGEGERNRSEAIASVATASPPATVGALALQMEEPEPVGDPWDRDPDFGRLWDLAPPLMRKRAKSKAKVWPEWGRAKRRALPAAILAGFARFKAMDADLPRSGGPGLHIWLKDRTWEQWAGSDPTDAWTEAEWTVALRIWRDTGEWGEAIGPPPGSPGCRVPPRLLVQPAADRGPDQ